MDPKWENMGLCVVKTAEIQQKSLDGNGPDGIPIYFRVICKDSSLEISWKGLDDGKYTIHMVWATPDGKIIDECLYPGKIWDQVEYFKHLYSITKSEGKQLRIDTQTFSKTVDLSQALRFNPISTMYV
jgi:hypothetical protein